MTIGTEPIAERRDRPHSSTLSPSAKPGLLVDVGPGELRQIDLVWCELLFKPPHAERITAFVSQCDGRRNLTEIAQALNWSTDRAVSIAATLFAKGVVMDASLADVPASICQQHLVSWGRTLRSRMSAAVDILGGTLHRRRLLGSLVETYHFVSAASEHIGAAVAHAPSRAVRDGLSRLFADEWKHGVDLRKGLLAAGLTDDEIDSSEPLPGTRSVINYLRELGDTDLLAYGVCAAINESPKSDTAIKQSWDDIARRGLLPPGAIEPFKGHELEDEASGHSDVSALVFSEHGTISGAQQRRIRDHVVSFIATQRACYEAMKEYYDDPRGEALWRPA